MADWANRARELNSGKADSGSDSNNSAPNGFYRSDSNNNVDQFEKNGWTVSNEAPAVTSVSHEYSSAPEAQATYWRNLRDSYDADPYIDDAHPGYKDPFGWGKDFVYAINQDLDNRTQDDFTSYREDDETWKMIQWRGEQLKEENEKTVADGLAGRPRTDGKKTEMKYNNRSEAEHESGIFKHLPGSPESTQTAENEKSFGLLKHLPHMEKPEAVQTEFVETLTPQQSLLQNETVSGWIKDHLRSQGIPEEMLDEVATEMAEKFSDNDAKLLLAAGAGAKGLGNVWDVVKNVGKDVGSVVMGVNPETGNNDRDQYQNLYKEGLKYYSDHTENIPMNHLEFARRYAEYFFRLQTGERYDGTVDLQGFSEYLPDVEELKGQKALGGSMSSLLDTPGNRNAFVNSDNSDNSDNTEVSNPVNKGDLSDAEYLWTLMNGDTLPTELEMPDTQMTQADYNELMIQLTEMEMDGTLGDFLDVEKNGSVENLNFYEKAMFYLLPAVQDSGVQGASYVGEKFGHNLVTTAMSAGVMGNIGELVGSIIAGPAAGKVGRFLGTLIGFGIPYSEQLFGYKLPYYDEIMEFFDKGQEWVESQIGNFSYSYYKAFGREMFSDPDHYVGDVLNIIKYPDLITAQSRQGRDTYSKKAFDIAGKYAMNVGMMPGQGSLVRGAMSVVPMASKIAEGQDPETARLNPNEVYRYNLGYSEKYSLEGNASERFQWLLEFAQKLLDRGVPEDVIDQAIAQRVAGAMGTNDQIYEMTYGEAVDPMNLAEGSSANALYGLGVVTGDVNLQNAAISQGGGRINPMDLINMPGMDTAVTTFGKILGKEWHKSGGLGEVLDVYDMHNKYGNLENVTKAGRRYSGIDAEGKVKGWEPQTHNGIMDSIRNFVSRTDETRVLYLTDTANTFINLGLSNANGDPAKIIAFVEQLANPDIIQKNDPLYDISQSAIFNTFKEDIAESVHNSRGKIDAIIKNWDTFANNRQVLNELSERLKLQPSKVVEYGQNKNSYLRSLIIQDGQKNGMNLSQAQQYADAVLTYIAPFFGEKDKKGHFVSIQPWSPQSLSYAISDAIGDGMQNVMLEKYNIQPMNVVYRFADTIKTVQSNSLLGLSTTYLMNNILNNVVTRGAVGIGGISALGTIEDYFTRMGVRSERFGDSIADEIGQRSKIYGEKTQYARMKEAIAKKKEVKGLLRNIKKGGDWVNQHIGIFSMLSSRVEESESKQAIYAATKTYMDRTWKPGVNLTAMPPALEAALDAQAPGMKKAIYSAIMSGLNMQEINDAVMGDYVQPGLKQSFLDAATERYGLDGENIVGQLLDKTGLLDTLKAELEGKTAEERAKVFSDFAKRLEAQTTAEVAQNLADRAEDVKTHVQGEGFMGALDHAIEMADMDVQVRLGSMDRWSTAFTKRLHEQMTVAKWREDVSNIQQVNDAVYNQYYATRTQIYDGILQGLGLDDNHKVQYVEALRKTNTLWTDFYQKKSNLFREYRRKAAFIEGENPTAWQIRAQTAWQEFLDGMENLYDHSGQEELKQMKIMDDAMVAGFKQASGLDTELNFMNDYFKLIRDIREQQLALYKDIRQQERTLAEYSEKDILWKNNQGKLQQFDMDIARLKKELYTKLRPFEKQMKGIQQNIADIDYDAIVKADIAHREAENIKKGAEPFADRLFEKVEENKLRPEYMLLKDIPTVNEAETLFDSLKDKVSPASQESLHDAILIMAGLSEGSMTASELAIFARSLSDEDLNKILALGARYDSGLPVAMNLAKDIVGIAEKISEKVYPKIQITDKKDKSQRQLARSNGVKRNALINDIIQVASDIAVNAKPVDTKLFNRVSKQISNDDRKAINNAVLKYNETLYKKSHPELDMPELKIRTEKVKQYQHGVYKIVAVVKDGDKIIALVPKDLPKKTITVDDNIQFPVLGIDPNDPLGLVYQIKDQYFTATPKDHMPEENPTGGTAYAPAVEMDKMATIDPIPLAKQEVTYKDLLPLIDEVARRYDNDLLEAQTQKLSDLDTETRQAVKSYIDDVVAKDMSNAKYKALRYGEMMRDAALLNYSDRRGFDNMLTAISPYQYWLTRSMYNWTKRMLDHPRLYSHYYHLKKMEEKNEKEFYPNRLQGKVGIPMIGWQDWMGGRVFFNPAQFFPMTNFLQPLEDIMDKKNIATRKAETLLDEMYQSNEISPSAYQLARNEHKGDLWDEVYSQTLLDEHVDESAYGLLSNYFSGNVFASYAKAKLLGTDETLGSMPATRVGNAISYLFQDEAPEAAKLVRDATSAPERLLRKLFNIDYDELGAYGDSLINRRLTAMLSSEGYSEEEIDAAFMEKDGNPIYDKAVNDVRTEMMLRVPAMGTAYSVKNLFKDNGIPFKDKLANLFLQLSLSPFGEYLYTTGEENVRSKKAEYQKAAEAFANGDKNAFSEYYDENPDAELQRVTYKPKDMQLRYLLYNTINSAYYSLPEQQRRDVRSSLGTKFVEGVISKDTRAIDTMPLEELAAYAKALNGNLPYAKAPELKGVDIPEYHIDYTPDSLIAEIDEYNKYIAEQFPAYETAQNYYYSLETKEERQAFLKAFPMLQEKWDYDKKYFKDHKDVEAVIKRNKQFNTDSNAEKIYNSLDPLVLGTLGDYAFSGEDVPEWVNYYIRKAVQDSGAYDKGDETNLENILSYIRSHTVLNN